MKFKVSQKQIDKLKKYINADNPKPTDERARRDSKRSQANK